MDIQDGLPEFDAENIDSAWQHAIAAKGPNDYQNGERA